MAWVIDVRHLEWQEGFIVNIMHADDLVTQGARSSAAMVLTFFV